MLNYDEYNRANQLNQIKELSDSDARNNPNAAEEISEKDKFTSEIDTLVSNLVHAVSAVKRSHAQHLKEDFVGAVSSVAAGTQAIITEINNFEPFRDSTDIMLAIEIDDLDSIESKTGSLDIEDDEIPMPYKQLLRRLEQNLQSAVRLAMFKGKVASGSSPHPQAATEMIQSTVPCLLGVKKIVTVAKDGANKWAKTYAGQQANLSL